MSSLFDGSLSGRIVHSSLSLSTRLSLYSSRHLLIWPIYNWESVLGHVWYWQVCQVSIYYYVLLLLQYTTLSPSLAFFYTLPHSFADVILLLCTQTIVMCYYYYCSQATSLWAKWHLNVAKKIILLEIFVSIIPNRKGTEILLCHFLKPLFPFSLLYSLFFLPGWPTKCSIEKYYQPLRVGYQAMFNTHNGLQKLKKKCKQVRIRR